MNPEPKIMTADELRAKKDEYAKDYKTPASRIVWPERVDYQDMIDALAAAMAEPDRSAFLRYAGNAMRTLARTNFLVSVQDALRRHITDPPFMAAARVGVVKEFIDESGLWIEKTLASHGYDCTIERDERDDVYIVSIAPYVGNRAPPSS